MYSLTDFDTLSDVEVNQLLTHLNVSLEADPSENRKNAILMSYQHNLIQKDDLRYVESPYFWSLMKMNEPELQSYASRIGFSEPITSRISLIQKVLTYIFEKLITKVVCVKVQDIRPKYQNLKEWMADPQNVYIGRGRIVMIPTGEMDPSTGKEKKARFPPEDTVWGNPFRGEGCLSKYREYIIQKIQKGDITKYQLEQLRGKNLGCWCKTQGQDKPCHGDILLELLKNPQLLEPKY